MILIPIKTPTIEAIPTSIPLWITSESITPEFEKDIIPETEAKITKNKDKETTFYYHSLKNKLKSEQLKVRHQFPKK